MQVRQAEQMRDRRAEIDALSDDAIAELMADISDRNEQAAYRHGGATAVRARMKDDLQKDGGPLGPVQRDHHHINSFCELNGALQAAAIMQARRQLPAPAELSAAAGDGNWLLKPSSVNPTVWPAKKPYTSRGGAGGLASPWELMHMLACLDPFDKYWTDSASKKFAASAPDAAIRIFGRAAAALRRLTGAAALTVELDVGDVASLPRRRQRKVDEHAYALPAGVYDRIHLNNVPDYVRPAPACRIVTCL